MASRIQVPKMYKLFIGGKFTRTESERYIEVFNPSTGEKICNISRASRKDLRNAVVSARSGYESWSAKTGYERGQILYRFAEMLEGRKEQFIQEISSSTGKTLGKCIEEVNAAIDRIIYYAGFCDKWIQVSGSVNPVQQGYFNFSIPEPVGIVGIVLPDNLSLLPLVSRISAVLCGGNSCVVIANEKYPLPALTLSEVIATSDFPGGVVNLLTGYKSELISHLAGHFDINAIDFCEDDGKNKKLIQELCANNVKRFRDLGIKKESDWFNKDKNENLVEIEKFSEIKTVWHTMQ